MSNITDPFVWSDLDWFALDNNDSVAHFASGGGGVPLQIADTDFEEFSNYFRNLPELNDNTITVNPKLLEIDSYRTASDKSGYLKDYVLFAKRGLFSFDKTRIAEPKDVNYHLVVYPSRLLSSNDISPFILEKLARYKEEGGFRVVERINIFNSF